MTSEQTLHAQERNPGGQPGPDGQAPGRTPFLDAVRDYVARGWVPTPVERPRPGDDSSGKRPILKDWTNRRLTPEEFETYWGGSTPCNIGVLCGEPSRLVCLDFDNSEVGLAWIRRWPDVYAATLVARRSNAPEGRCHVWFSLAEGQAPPANSEWPKHWELRSTGRQTVVPPSVHYTGGIYDVVHNPDVLLPWRDEYLPPRPAASDRQLAYAQAALASEAEAVATATEGGRNNRLNVAALKCGQFVAAGLLALPEVEDALLTAAVAAGLPEREARATIASGLRKGQTEPRTAPQAVAPPSPGAGPRPKGTPGFILESDTPPGEAPEPWGEVAPLEGAGEAPPPWPWEALPPTLGGMGQAIAATINVPECMAGAAVVAAASAAVSNRVRLRLKDDHVIAGNTYTLIAASVTMGKTASMKPLLAPLRAWEESRMQAFKRAWAEHEARRSVAKKTRARLEGQVASAQGPDRRELEAELQRVIMEEAEEPPGEPRLFCEDCTSEALGRRLLANQERMGVISSEGRQVLAIARGRYSKDDTGGDLNLWLKGYAGDPCRVDRQTRPSYCLNAPCLSALVMTQPDALVATGQSAEARESGFLTRWLFVAPEANLGTYPRESIPDGTRLAYEALVAAILDLDGQAVCAMAPEAFELWWGVHRELTRESGAAHEHGQALFADWLAKSRETCARLALVLHVCRTLGTAGFGTVTVEDVIAATTLCDVYKAHAQRAFHLLGDSPEAVAARRLWAWIDRNRLRLHEWREKEGLGPITAVKPRDIMRAELGGLTEAEAIVRALTYLGDRGYLQLVTWRRPGAGKFSDLWYVRPTEGGPR